MKKILLIEDDEVTSELIGKALQRRGYQVLSAVDGVRGYELAVESSPDLIVTDISMPGADGVHVIRRIRDTPQIEFVPILVITGYGSGTATFALAQGATAYEPKPLNPEAFLDSVDRLVGQA
jgi:CheY-like chemotaxis protein